MLTRFPIVVVATNTVAAALADWRAQTRFLVIAAALSAAVIALILFLIIRQINPAEPRGAAAAGGGKAAGSTPR